MRPTALALATIARAAALGWTLRRLGRCWLLHRPGVVAQRYESLRQVAEALR